MSVQPKMTQSRLVERGAARLWRRVDKNGPIPADASLGNCWVWTGPLDRLGYGHLWFLRAMPTVHRISWFLQNGKWPEPCALHKCDNRACVRPDHLFEGTHADNMADMAAKGRAKPNGIRGSRHPRAKLTEDDVREIRRMLGAGVSQPAVAKRFGVSRSAINNVANSYHWRHVS